MPPRRRRREYLVISSDDDEDVAPAPQEEDESEAEISSDGEEGETFKQYLARKVREMPTKPRERSASPPPAPAPVAEEEPYEESSSSSEEEFSSEDEQEPAEWKVTEDDRKLLESLAVHPTDPTLDNFRTIWDNEYEVKMHNLSGQGYDYTRITDPLTRSLQPRKRLWIGRGVFTEMEYDLQRWKDWADREERVPGDVARHFAAFKRKVRSDWDRAMRVTAERETVVQDMVRTTLEAMDACMARGASRSAVTAILRGFRQRWAL